MFAPVLAASAAALMLFSASSHATVFTIDEGEHSSHPTVVKLFSGTRMDMTFAFDESARYEFPTDGSGIPAEDQRDTNKLYGFSDCKTLHQQNSARFGWRWYMGELQIMAFTHRGGKFSWEFIKRADLNRSYYASIELTPDRTGYVYTFDGTSVQVPRGCDDDVAVGYHLQPYFGGNQVAPHSIRIRVMAREAEGPAYAELPMPNPSAGKVFVPIKAFADTGVFVRVLDVLGRVVWISPTESFAAGEERVLSFDLGLRVASGMYYVEPFTVDAQGEERRASVAVQAANKVLKVMIAR